MSNLSENQVHDGRIVVQDALKLLQPWMIASLGGGLLGIAILSNQVLTMLAFLVFIVNAMVLKANVSKLRQTISAKHLLLFAIPCGITMSVVIAHGLHARDGAFRIAMAVGGTVTSAAVLAFIGTYAWRYLNAVLVAWAVLWLAMFFLTGNVVHDHVTALQWFCGVTGFGAGLWIFKWASKSEATSTGVALGFCFAVLFIFMSILGPPL